MSVSLSQLIRGREYLHRVRGQCTFIASHPHDGAYLVMEAYDAEEDVYFYFSCESEELSVLEAEA